jgi:two-component system chemotaxis response regulator CheY
MKTCLVVDDSSVIRKVAKRILEGMEFQIMEAEDGQQALDQCQRMLPDAILLAWNMPKEYIMKPFDRDIVEAKFQEVGLI